MPAKQFRNVCFTCHECNPEHGVQNGSVQFCIYGLEKCPTTGKPHLQGYYQFHGKITLKWYKENICSTCHIAPANGTAQQNITYCSKEGKVTQYGTPKNPGKRTDLENITEELKQGTPLHDVIMDHPATYIRNYRGIKDAMCVLAPPQERKVEVIRMHQLGSQRPEGEIYYYDCQLGAKPYAYHGQETMVVYHYNIGDVILSNTLNGLAFCIMDVPCMVTKVYIP